MTFDPTCNVPPGCRVETDLLGMALVPEASLFGLQTQRAIANFPISGRPITELPLLIRSLAQVKKAAALTNLANDEIERTVAEGIIERRARRDQLSAFNRTQLKAACPLSAQNKPEN